MQPNRRRFLLWWLGLWALLAPRASLSVNPPSTSALHAFWNPAVWGAMVSVAGVLAWLVDRYHAQLKAFFDHHITRCFLMAVVWANMGGDTWTNGLQKHDTFRQVVGGMVLFLAFLFFAKGIELLVKAIIQRYNRKSPSPPTSP